MLDHVKFVFHLLKFSLDPTNTEQVFRITDSLREAASPEDKKRMGDAFMKDPGIKAMYESGGADLLKKPYDIKALAKLPPQTLGREYSAMMAAGGYDPEFFEYIDVKTPLDFVAVRMRKTHDIWHTMTGFATDVPGELGLQGFYLGQLASPAPLGIIASVLLHVIAQRDPALIRNAFDQLVAGYEAGKRAESLAGVVWEDHWGDDLATLRRRYKVEPYRGPAAKSA